MKEKTYVCIKCKKETKKTDGRLYLEGTAFCCKECDKDQKKKKSEDDNTCEFC